MPEKRNTNFLLVFSLVVLWVFPSCNADQVYNETYDLENASWSQSNVLNYRFSIEDTLQPHHVLFNIRHTSRYKYRNIYLFVTTTSPEGATIRDTFELMLADDKGRWHGNGWGDVYEMTTPYKRFVRFPNKGTYSMEVQQAMRTENLQHVTDFGVQIVKAKNKEQ